MFAIIVALVEGGRTIAGWIHDPINKRNAWAEQGQGAWLDGAPVRYPDGSDPQRMQGFVGWGFRRNVLEKTRPQALEQLGPLSSLNCAGQEYVDIMAGNRQFNLYRQIKPWDHAAGVLMVQEAGGHAARFDGSPYLPGEPEGGLITAPDGASWRKLHDILLGGSPAEIEAFPKR
jgi:fructose-1,6-bisphosphatase/inositol monophosphatase family enzyme